MPLTGEYAPSPDDWSREQAELFERTHGAEGNLLQGKPIIVLTTLGAKSGKIRNAPEHPTWFHNIVDAPLVELQDGPVRKDYTPRELSGDERAVWWERSVEAWPAYADYATKTDRLIPVFLLTPVE
jgi:hypothetical protein